MNPIEISFMAAMGAGAGLILASLIHISWLELPFMLMGMVGGAAAGYFGLGALGDIL